MLCVACFAGVVFGEYHWSRCRSDAFRYCLSRT